MPPSFTQEARSLLDESSDASSLNSSSDEDEDEEETEEDDHQGGEGGGEGAGGGEDAAAIIRRLQRRQRRDKKQEKHDHFVRLYGADAPLPPPVDDGDFFANQVRAAIYRSQGHLVTKMHAHA